MCVSPRIFSRKSIRGESVWWREHVWAARHCIHTLTVPMSLCVHIHTNSHACNTPAGNSTGAETTAMASVGVGCQKLYYPGGIPAPYEEPEYRKSEVGGPRMREWQKQRGAATSEMRNTLVSLQVCLPHVCLSLSVCLSCCHIFLHDLESVCLFHDQISVSVFFMTNCMSVCLFHDQMSVCLSVCLFHDKLSVCLAAIEIQDRRLATKEPRAIGEAIHLHTYAYIDLCIHTVRMKKHEFWHTEYERTLTWSQALLNLWSDVQRNHAWIMTCWHTDMCTRSQGHLCSMTYWTWAQSCGPKHCWIHDQKLSATIHESCQYTMTYYKTSVSVSVSVNWHEYTHPHEQKYNMIIYAAWHTDNMSKVHSRNHKYSTNHTWIISIYHTWSVAYWHECTHPHEQKYNKIILRGSKGILEHSTKRAAWVDQSS